MSDEFDDTQDLRSGRSAPPGRDRAQRAARLLSRLYGSASPGLRARLVACLVRPLGPLGLSAVAAGAFAVLLSPRGPGAISVALADVARFSKEQIAELARFVEQASPEALQQAAGLVADNPIGVGAFSVSVALLLAFEMRRNVSDRRRRRERVG